MKQHLTLPVKFILAIIASCNLVQLTAQQGVELKIVEYRFNDTANAIEFFVKAIDAGNSSRLEKNEIFFFETFENEKEVPLEIRKISVEEKEAESSLEEQEHFTVLFLTALNREGGASFDQQRQQLISSFLKISLPASTEYYLAAYGDHPYLPPKNFSSRNLQATMSEFPATSSSFDMYAALIDGVRFLKSKAGRRILVLLSDGLDSPDNAAYGQRMELPYDSTDIKQMLGQLDDNFLIFPLGFEQPGTDAEALRFIADATPSKQDTSSVGNELPESLRSLLYTKRNIIYNNLVQLDPNPAHKIYRGEKRKIKVLWNGQELEFDMSSIGSDESPMMDLLDKDYASWQAWFWRFLIGLGLVGAALAMMVWLVPWSRELAFRKRYIVPYKSKEGIRKRDPLSGEVFQEGELVVVKCPHVTSSLNTWEYVGKKCPQYPRCLNFDPPCAGHGAPQSLDRFNSMTGIFRRLNWLWYGMLGGLLAWSVLGLFRLFAYDWYFSLVQGWFRHDAQVEGQGAQLLDRFINNLANDLILGVALGTGICLALSYIEEKSQPRRFSWWRLLMRTTCGIVVSLLVFLLGFYLQYANILPNHLVAGLATWTLFGVAIGTVMSVGSSISLWRGILGGVIASLLSWAVYLLLLEHVFVNDYPLAKLISLLALGGIFGITLVTVVSALEDFELEYISPEAFRQTNPISKWLKKNIDVFIGTEEGSYVYVKWSDEMVQPRHARLHFKKGVVYIEPRAETLLNGNVLPVNRSTPLQDGDLIQLGKESISRMRFRERRKAGTPPRPDSKGDSKFNMPTGPDDAEPKFKINR